MGKLTHNLYTCASNYMFLSQFEGEEFLPAKTYAPQMAYTHGYILVEVADADYFGGGTLYSVSIRRDQARRMLVALRAHYKAVRAQREKLASLLVLCDEDVPF